MFQVRGEGEGMGMGHRYGYVHDGGGKGEGYTNKIEERGEILRYQIGP